MKIHILIAAIASFALASCVTDQGSATPVVASQPVAGGPISATPLAPVDLGREPVTGVLVVPKLGKSQDSPVVAPASSSK